MAVGNGYSGEPSPVAGVKVSAVASGVRYQNRLDLVLMELAPGSRVAAVSTRNAFCAAPVLIMRQHLKAGGGQVRYLLVNTGNANAGTGEKGLEDARACCNSLAKMTGVDPTAVLPFSTGVIGENLPVSRILEALPAAGEALGAENWGEAARGIMTTDTRPKALSVRLTCGDKFITVTGIAKGSGMIRPNMATLLSFVFTDAAIEQDLLQQMLSDAVSRSFNRITVDGDTSTNDCCTLAATGASGIAVSHEDEALYKRFNEALQQLLHDLAIDLIKDAEGATKFITVRIEEGGDEAECLRVAYVIAESPLVKTALFASDPNWGRILAAVGRAGLSDLDVSKVAIYLGEVCIVENGMLAESYREELGQEVMDKEEITITVRLARGSAIETVWTSDLSEDYVRINADYRS